MYPSPGQVAAIGSFVAAHGGWGQSTASIRAAMGGATVPNPVTSAPAVPVPYTFADLVGRLDATAAGKLCAMAGLPTLIDQINGGDATAAARWVGLLELAGVVTADQGAALLGVATATGPDPSWTAVVAWDIGTLGRPVDDFDVEAARAASAT